MRTNRPQVVASPSEDTQTNISGLPKVVFQIDPTTGEIIKEYASIASAAKSIGINSKSIYDVLRGKQKRAGGYYWQSFD